MNQLALDLARDIGTAAAHAAMSRAERNGFDREGATACIDNTLRELGPTSGEELTDRAKAAGFVPTDDRSFGGIYASLARRGVIVHHDWCERAKGHGTGGGHIWRLA